MANDKEFNGLGSGLADSRNGVAEDRGLGREGGGFLNWRWTVMALRRRRLLITCGVGALVSMFILTNFVLHKKYAAQAVIRPVMQDQSGLGSLLQSSGLLPQSGAQNMQSGPPDPNELIAIMEGYAFTISMLKQEHLTPKLLKGSWDLKQYIPFIDHDHGPPSDYSMYLLMRSRFDTDFNLMTGNMTLSFVDKDLGLAPRILGLYIDRVRDQVRAQTVRDTAAALHSLEEEAAKTPDPLLRDQIYGIIGIEMEQLKTAEANADFAFTVIDPPFVSPFPTAPWVVFDSLAAAALVPLLVYFWLVAQELRRDFKHHLAEVDSEAGHPANRGGWPRRAPSPEEDRPYRL